MSLEIPTSMTAVRVIAGVTLRRSLRAMLLVSLLCAVLPAAYVALVKANARHFDLTDVLNDAFSFETLLLGLVAPLIVGWPIGDEIEDKTATYLWARPISRWTILIGKLVALAPIVFAVFFLGWSAAALVGGTAPSGGQLAALGLGVIAASCAAAGLALLLPKHPLILSLVVLAVVDQTLGAMPASIRQITISQQIRVLAGVSEGDAVTAGIALVVIASLWLWLGLWRIRKTQL